ncbi:MAG: hypothetical protein LBO08_02190 [Rickettsiales bacterium]|nr:hypothetical protein [Rickettsiales bacterium]
MAKLSVQECRKYLIGIDLLKDKPDKEIEKLRDNLTQVINTLLNKAKRDGNTASNHKSSNILSCIKCKTSARG